MQLEDQAEHAFGLRAAFEIFCRLEPHPAPPFEVFEQSYDQDWFQQAFSSRVVLVGEEPTLEALRTIQTSYLEHFRTAKALKRDRTSLIVLALREGFLPSQFWMLPSSRSTICIRFLSLRASLIPLGARLKL